ncbi:MAG TPA: hypothetical protein VMF90_05315 [Rhizobiaceae bacterium]|nr:hypothetical protein [Rhizobiaceae bacterium]
MFTRLALVLTAALVAQKPAAAAEMGWFSGGDELNAELRYGTADKSETPISFWCEPARGVVYVAWEFRPANPSEAMDVDFTLSAGGIDVPLGGVGYHVGDTGFVVESQIIYDQKFRDLIASDGDLTATAEGKTETFPLAGAKEKAPVLLEMCERTG